MLKRASSLVRHAERSRAPSMLPRVLGVLAKHRVLARMPLSVLPPVVLGPSGMPLHATFGNRLLQINWRYLNQQGWKPKRADTAMFRSSQRLSP